MQVWTCYIISMPSGGLVIIQSSNQSVTSALGWRKSTVNSEAAAHAWGPLGVFTESRATWLLAKVDFFWISACTLQ
jgi:hypothetical protein